MKNTEF